MKLRRKASEKVGPHAGRADIRELEKEMAWPPIFDPQVVIGRDHSKASKVEQDLTAVAWLILHAPTGHDQWEAVKQDSVVEEYR